MSSLPDPQLLEIRHNACCAISLTEHHPFYLDATQKSPRPRAGSAESRLPAVFILPLLLSPWLAASLLIEQKVRNDLAELLILIAQITHLSRLDPAQVIVLAAPAVERGFGDAQLPAYLHRRRSIAYLSERSNDLVFRELAWSHPAILHAAALHDRNTDGAC